MNSTEIRRTAATLATAAAAVLALGTVGASPADAERPVPDGCGTTTVGSNNLSGDIAAVVDKLKVQRVQFLLDNPRLLR
jgi:hypothetical protein